MMNLSQNDYGVIYLNKAYFSKGKRGYVYLSEFKGKTYVIKEKNPDSQKVGAIKNEVKFNKLLNKINIGPKFHYYNKDSDYLVRDYVDGTEIFLWIEKNLDKTNFNKFFSEIILNIFEQCRRMDLAGINKLELTRPSKDILITKNNKPIIIDFERCKQTNNPKNVTQFCQFLISGKLSFFLNKKGLILDKDKLINLAREYKENLSFDAYNKIMLLVKKTLNC